MDGSVPCGFVSGGALDELGMGVVGEFEGLSNWIGRKRFKLIHNININQV